MGFQAKKKFAKQGHEKGHFSIVLFVKPKKKRYLCTMKKGRQQAARYASLRYGQTAYDTEASLLR